MRLYDRLATPKDLTEIVERRTLHSKAFDLGKRRRKVVQSLAPLHYQDASKRDLQDIDLQPVLQPDGMWRVDKAAYKLIVDPTTATLRHESRATGLRARVGLKAIGGNTVVLPEPVVEDGRIFWPQVVEGVDIELVLRPHGAEWFKIVHSADAPHEFTWTVERELAFPEDRIKLQTEGNDAAGNRLRMAHRQGQKRQEAGWEKFDLTETFQRQVSKIVDRKTRRRDWVAEVEYPVRIDQDITETIGATADDGWAAANGALWFSNNTYVGVYFGNYSTQRAGLRFQTVAVPQGATIDLATLKVYQTSLTGTINGLWYGDDVDDAAGFANNNAPFANFTKTTASATAVTGSNSTVVSQNVTSIVQELVDRGGWASGNDMRFGLERVGTTYGFWRFEDYGAAGTNQAVLEIDYTEAGGGAAYPVQHFRNMGVWA